MPSIKATHYRIQVKIFEAAGCQYVRTQGDHLTHVYQFLHLTSSNLLYLK